MGGKDLVYNTDFTVRVVDMDGDGQVDTTVVQLDQPPGPDQKVQIFMPVE